MHYLLTVLVPNTSFCCLSQDVNKGRRMKSRFAQTCDPTESMARVCYDTISFAQNAQPRDRSNASLAASITLSFTYFLSMFL